MPHGLFRRFAFLAHLIVLVACAASGERAGAEERPPITGKAVPRLKQLDHLMLEILRDRYIPGGSLAIARGGRLVFARGYGWADVENKKPVRPSARFNIASCTKPITAAAILKLVDQGKLRLDDKVFTVLDDLKPPAGAKVDPRLREITVRQLLHHASGLGRGHGAPLKEIARRMNVELPITVAQLTAFNMGRPLLFAPGTEAKYSNLGFLMLRLVVERAAGQDYETFTAERVLKPMGIPDAHLDLMDGYRPREVNRYPAGKRHDGGHGELKGGGNWVISPTDAMRFPTSLDGSRGERVLSPQAYRQMLAPLASSPTKPDRRHNGLGWDAVQRMPAGILYSKNGAVAGIATYMQHLPNGVNWAVFFNGNFDKNGDDEAAPRKISGKHPYAILRKAIEKIDKWPAHDLFSAE